MCKSRFLLQVASHAHSCPQPQKYLAVVFVTEVGVGRRVGKSLYSVPIAPLFYFDSENCYVELRVN